MEQSDITSMMYAVRRLMREGGLSKVFFTFDEKTDTITMSTPDDPAGQGNELAPVAQIVGEPRETLPWVPPKEEPLHGVKSVAKQVMEARTPEEFKAAAEELAKVPPTKR